jgi:uncharacterized protein (TIGR00251 family)
VTAAPRARLAVKVVPGAAASGVVGWLGDELKVRVSAPPERGRANAELIGVLAAALAVPPRSLRVVSGAAGPRKVVEIDGLDAAAVRARLPPS